MGCALSMYYLDFYLINWQVDIYLLKKKESRSFTNSEVLQLIILGEAIVLATVLEKEF